MKRLAPGPVPVQMYFVKPHVKRGDYYLMINPITGRRMWVYPRMMGTKQFPVVSALGTDTDPLSQLLSTFDPTRITRELDQTREELGQAQSYMKLAIGASLVASVVAIWSIMRPRRDDYV